MMKFNLTNQNNKLIKQREEAIKKHNEVIRKHNESVKERRSRDLFSHKNLYPITFSIPESKVININEINIKTKLLSSLIPGVQSTYIYNNEADYYDEYKKSFFLNKSSPSWSWCHSNSIWIHFIINYSI